MRYFALCRLEPTLTAPKRKLVGVANRVEPDAEGHSDCDGPNNDDYEVGEAPLSSNQLSAIAKSGTIGTWQMNGMLDNGSRMDHRWLLSWVLWDP